MNNETLIGVAKVLKLNEKPKPKVIELIITFKNEDYLNSFIEMLEIDKKQSVENGVLKWKV